MKGRKKTTQNGGGVKKKKRKKITRGKRAQFWYYVAKTLGKRSSGVGRLWFSKKNCRGQQKKKTKPPREQIKKEKIWG